MTTRRRDNIQCELFKKPSKKWLEKAWCELEIHAVPNFFLSWLWIGTWLDCFVDAFSVIEARKSGKTVGLGILVTKPASFLCGGLRAKHYLHRTGVPKEDQIWIEYNDFLMVAECATEIRAAMVSRAINLMGSTEALIIGASEAEKFSCINKLGISQRKVWETTNYCLELTSLRESGVSLLDTLSRSARYQITRSLRKYQEIGELTVNKVQTEGEAKALLALAGPYHLARWGRGKAGSGFANDKFVAFHQKLVGRGLETGAIELYHIKAGEETIAIMHNFIANNRMYFYLCAINYCHSNPQFKPGLVAHYLLIKRALIKGLDAYDFMGGTARYKATFANKQGSLAVYQFEHPRPLLAVENAIRRVKQRLMHESDPYYP